MDFTLTPEQEMLQETARRFVDKVCPPEKAKEWDEAHHYPQELFDGFVDLGWFDLPFAGEGAGGGRANVLECVLLAEELGRASLDIAQCYIVTLIAGLCIDKWGSPEMRAELFPDLVAGRKRLAIGLSEPDAGSDAASLRTTATDDGDRWIVNGQKMWCTGAGLPGTSILCYVRTDTDAPKHRGISVVLIDPQSPGVELRKIGTLARHILGTYEVYLDNVEVPKEQLVGEVNRGWEVMLSGIDIERVLMSGGYVGVAQATLDEALEYAKQRQAFGRPIGEFQAITHALADLQTEIDAARLLAYRAAWLCATGQDSSRAGAMAKLKGSETYVAAARLGMQVCAGHGFATESVMSFRYRESIVAPISGGTSQIQRNGIARTMGLRGY
jgi:alkylation response protein AidB-like acyl-CoA dehydrogenase